MIDIPGIPLMTKYFLKKILRKHEKYINVNESSQNIENINDIDFEQVIANLHRDVTQQAICIKQLETLATMYQIYSKQNKTGELEPIELKILYLLGYSI